MTATPHLDKVLLAAEQVRGYERRTAHGLEDVRPSERQVFYHGTRAMLRPGDLVEHGGRRANYSGFKGKVLEGEFATTSHENARGYARDAHGDGMQRTYQVEPTGPYREDPHAKGEFVSAHPWRVVREAWHDPDWDEDPRPWYEQEYYQRRRP